MKPWGVNIILLIMLIIPVVLSEQEKVVYGAVNTFDAFPLVGMEIQANSAGQIVKTDLQRRFPVGVNNMDKLKATAHRFNSQSTKLKEITKVSGINMNFLPGEKGRAYAIGLGHVLDEEKFKVISQRAHEDVGFSKYSTMNDLKVEKFAGAHIMGNQGIIRGIKVISNNTALIAWGGLFRNENV